jgi:hypothetical protein
MPIVCLTSLIRYTLFKQVFRYFELVELEIGYNDFFFFKIFGGSESKAKKKKW